MFKLSIYEKVENKREKAPMLHAPGLICIPFCLKSRSHSVQNGPDRKRVERIINTRL
mgnify:CR=1 FL=1